MSGFEMRAQFYPLVTDLKRLKEEAAEGVPYPFLTEEVLELSPKDYRQFCSALGQRYAFETDIPKEGYDTVYGAFHCSLVTAVSEKEAILLTRVAGQNVERNRLYKTDPKSDHILLLTQRLQELRKTIKLCKQIEEHSLEMAQRQEEEKRRAEQERSYAHERESMELPGPVRP